MVVRILTSLTLVVLAHFTWTSTAAEGWTREDASTHADRYNDASLWRSDWLLGDAARHQRERAQNEWMPFSTVVFPAPDYALSGRAVPGLGVAPLALPEPLIGTLAFVNDESGQDGEGITADYAAIPIRPVLVVVARGDEPLEHLDQQAVTRGHPHYFFQSAFINDDGEVDCVALQLADGRRIGIVNGRILDLDLGNLVLVRQFENGSVHIHQHRDVIDVASRAEIAGEIGRRLSSPAIQAFWR